jgi:RNA polymerase sigma-70 factor (ECF subfamily)
MVKGDEIAYRSFYDVYYERLWRYLLVVTAGDEDASREALQGALMRLVRYIKIFRSEEVFWSWLTVLARSALYDNQRKRGRYRAFLARFTEYSRIENGISSGTGDENVLSDALDEKVRELSADERDLIEQKYLKRLSVETMALQLRISEKAVESWLMRIRRKLKHAVLAELKDEQRP